MEKNMKQKLLQPMPCRAVTLLYQQVLSSAKNFRGWAILLMGLSSIAAAYLKNYWK
jgi:putative exporter of polyketide antibiotics